MACSYEIERELLKTYPLIAGVDEAGRGPLAGPVVSAMVILPVEEKDWWSQINDSKLLSPSLRNTLYERIINEAVDYQISEISPKVIDQINILEATKQSVYQSWNNIQTKPNYLILDALTIDEIDIPQRKIIKGDSKSYSIAAASILAKVYRDRLMEKLDERYPQYGFKSHKGYGVKKHLEMLQLHGPCPYHRMSFSPVKKSINEIF